jgi:hypothetical protein
MPPKSDLTSAERKQIVSHLLLRVKADTHPVKLKWGALKSTAIFFNRSTKTMQRVWKRACLSYEEPSILAFRANPLEKPGRPQKYDRDDVREAILRVPREDRGPLRKIAAAIGLSTTSLHGMKEDQDGCVICPHWNAIKPALDDHHKFARVLYAVANMNLDHETYHDYFNSVHVNKKWFFQQSWLYLRILCPARRLPKEHLDTRVTS